MSERNPKVVEAEIGFHQAITPWVGKHATKSGGEITDMGYNPDLSYHRIDEGYTPPKPLPSYATNRLMANRYYKKLRDELGHSQARAVVNAYRDTEAYKGANRSLADEVESRVENGEVVGLMIDHLEDGKLKDLIVATGGLIVAIGTMSFRNKTSAIMGRNIGRQEYKGKAVADTVSDAMGIIWVNQDTDSFKDLDIPKEAREIGDQAAKESLREIIQRGGLIAEVPAGTAMQLIYDEELESMKFVRPSVRGAVASLMKMDSLLPSAIYKGRIKPGPMEISSGAIELTRKERIENVAKALATLAVNGAALTGLPIEYEDFKSKGSVSVAIPDSVKV